MTPLCGTFAERFFSLWKPKGERKIILYFERISGVFLAKLFIFKFPMIPWHEYTCVSFNKDSDAFEMFSTSLYSRFLIFLYDSLKVKTLRIVRTTNCYWYNRHWWKIPNRMERGGIEVGLTRISLQARIGPANFNWRVSFLKKTIGTVSSHIIGDHLIYLPKFGLSSNWIHPVIKIGMKY